MADVGKVAGRAAVGAGVGAAAAAIGSTLVVGGLAPVAALLVLPFLAAGAVGAVMSGKPSDKKT